MRARELAQVFLRKASEDEALLDEVIDSPRVSDTTIGFHCQQAAEKLFKALLSRLGVRFRKTHDLRELMDLLADHGYNLPTTLSEVDLLTPFAVEFRYDVWPIEEVTSLDRRKARQMVVELRSWIERQLEDLV